MNNYTNSFPTARYKDNSGHTISRWEEALVYNAFSHLPRMIRAVISKSRVTLSINRKCITSSPQHHNITHDIINDEMSCILIIRSIPNAMQMYSQMDHDSDEIMSTWWWRLNSLASRLFTRAFIQAQTKENIKVPRHWPLWGEFTGHRLIPRTKDQ